MHSMCRVDGCAREAQRVMIVTEHSRKARTRGKRTAGARLDLCQPCADFHWWLMLVGSNPELR